MKIPPPPGAIAAIPRRERLTLHRISGQPRGIIRLRAFPCRQREGF
jgi:hypothetical protein